MNLINKKHSLLNCNYSASSRFKVFLPKQKNTFNLLFVGDTYFADHNLKSINADIKQNNLEEFAYEYSLKNMKPLMMSADFVVSNLESPIVNSTDNSQNQNLHWSDVTKTPDVLLKHNISLASIANDHLFDFGISGYNKTLEVLKEHGIYSIGAGKNIEEAGKPFLGIIDFGIKKFKFAIFTALDAAVVKHPFDTCYATQTNPGVMPLDYEIISQQVEQIKRSDPDIFIILFPHWGENCKWRSEEQIKMSNRLLLNGVDLIIGHGAHKIQEFEKHNDKWSIFNIGNFVLNVPSEYKALGAVPYSCLALLQIQLDENEFELTSKIYPIMSDNTVTNYQPRFLSKNEFEAFLEVIWSTKLSQSYCKFRNEDEYGHYIRLNVFQSKIYEPKNPINWIGLISGALTPIKSSTDIYSWLDRAIVLERELIKHGNKIFCYTPNSVNMQQGIVSGYIFETGQLKLIKIPVPEINYDFHFKTFVSSYGRKVYKQLTIWFIKNKYVIYPSKSIRDFTRDKLLSAEFLMQENKSITPYTEIFTGNINQLEKFLVKKTSVFIKPRFGNKGNGIIVIKKVNHSFQLEHNAESIITTSHFDSFSKCVNHITRNFDTQDYIIQQGIDCIQYNGSPISIRLVLFKVNDSWEILGELVIASKGSAIANVYQGGINYILEDMLPQVFPKDQVSSIMAKMKNLGIKVANAINASYDNMLNEIAYDILIDNNENIVIAELNVKPSLVGEPMAYRDFFNMNDQEKKNYDTLTVKHGEYLAKSLIDNNISKSTITQQYWFHDIKPNSRIYIKDPDALLESIFAAIKNHSTNLAIKINEIQNDLEARVVFLTVSDLTSKAKIYFGSGLGIVQAIQQALTHLFSVESALNIQYLKLDIVEEVKTIQDHPMQQPLNFDRSLYGFAFDQNIKQAYLAEELVAKTLINSQNQIKINRIIKYSRFSEENKNRLRSSELETIYLFKTLTFYMDSKIKLALYRGHRMINTLNPDLLLTAAINAGAYLHSCVRKTGEFLYEYLPKKDHPSHRYNILRHAGSIYSMLELYEVTKNEELLNAAKLALRNLINRARSVNKGKNTTLCIVEKDFVKLGANALTLLTIAKYTSITNDSSYLETGRQLAAWMQDAQGSSGEFYIYKQKYSTQKNTNFVSLYYPGEAIFSLVRFYQVDPNPVWLDIAKNATDYIINIRDKDKSISQIEHDHWLLYGLNELYRVRPAPIYIEHTKKICQAILNAQCHKNEPIDYLGSFYNPPRSTPVAIRAEGLCAAYHLLHDNQQLEFANQLLPAIQLCIRFQLQTQFQPERALYLPNPKRTLGGFSRSLTDYSIRIDYVQHNLSGIIHLYKILQGL